MQHLPDYTPQTWVSQPYALYKNGVLARHGITDATGHLTIDNVDAGATYAVELSNGARYSVPVSERLARRDDIRAYVEHRLSNRGVRSDGLDTAARRAQLVRGELT
ncbi:MAG: hypothetical protein EOP71_06020 [Variovorax sp.]|nr:MAG: hypothetical protein EOP71_06020 [Variovorax sp.]